MATSKTINVTGVTMSVPEMTDAPNASVFSTDVNALADAANANTTLADGIAGGLAKIANGDTHAALASGDYVFIKNHGTLSTGLYVAQAAIAANASLTASNVLADTSGGLNSINSNIANMANKSFEVVYNQSTSIGTDWTYVCPITVSKPSAIYVAQSYDNLQPTGIGISISSNSFVQIASVEGGNPRAVSAVVIPGTYYAWCKAGGSTSNTVIVYTCNL